MNILVINSGSSSLKFQVINMANEEILAKGLVERIGIEGSRLKFEPADKEKIVIDQDIPSHKEAIELVLKTLVDEKHGILSSLDEITAIGHRVLHGGEKYSESIVVDEDVKKVIRDCFVLGPLHNPANLLGIEACEELMPGKKNVAVFDTAFHQTMDPVNYMYALPYEYYEKYRVRRYGFHGTSHKYVSKRAAEILGKDKPNLIICHLGNGSSLSAVKEGKCIDTSMGLTPLEGLVMGTRCGDIDPAIIPFIGEKENLSYQDIDTMMNKKSGVLGISGVSSDFRDLETAAEEGNERARLALDMFVTRVIKYIGAYMTEFDSIDGICFTAGVGENSIEMRQQIAEGLKIFGVKIDEERNNVRGKDTIVSADDSTIKLLVVPTNEELMIAKDTVELTK
ncbi:acetate/propionate family kinase [Neofamilia massiliensis]|uniref:acetate/propionate family kinase n=1 Tax=Neofamilia massiliensis TaxID=1673724 RepID=UPI0006BB681C|nr:acetate kinase [Neofamilia massiliensis]